MEEPAHPVWSLPSEIRVERDCANRAPEYVDLVGIRRGVAAEAQIGEWLRGHEVPSWRRLRDCDLRVSCVAVPRRRKAPPGYELECRALAVQIARGLGARWPTRIASVDSEHLETGWVEGACEEGAITEHGRVVRHFGSCFDFAWVRVPLSWR
jgi:hypothetical protein